MNPDAILEQPAVHIGRQLHIYDRLDSTNSAALSLAEHEDSAGIVIVAREQTAGRGQHGRSWTSPPDTSVLMSAVVDVPPHLCRPVVLTAWAAVAVCDVIARTTGLSARIKWPNDVLIEGTKKVCGILIEMRRQAVVGIGLNVCQSAEHFAAAGLPDATSLLLASGVKLQPRVLTQQLCRRLDVIYRRLVEGKLRGLERSWRKYLGLIGERCTVECHDGERHGTVEGLHFGGVELRTAAGELASIQPESIRHFHPAV